MTSTRDRIMQSKLYKTVLWITLFSMGGGTLLFTPNLFKRFTGRPGVLSINGSKVSVKEFQAQVAHEYERFALLQQQLGEFAQPLLKQWGLDNPEEAATQELVTRTLLNQIADELGIHVPPSLFMQKLKDPSYIINNLRSIIPVSVLEQTGAINFALLQSYLARQGLTLADFEFAAQQAIRRNMASDLIENMAYVGQDAIKQFYINHYLPKKYAIVTFPLEKYLKEVKASSVPDAMLKDFFKQANTQNKQYWIPEKRTATIWKFSPETYGININTDEIESYYKQNKQQFIDQPVAVQVRRILFRINNNADKHVIEQKAYTVYQQIKEDPSKFADLAKIHSEDKESAAKGGLLDFFSRGQKNPAIERAAFRLQEDGGLSSLFMSDDGIELIQRVARKPATYKTLDAVKNEIATKLRNIKFAESFATDMQQLIEKQSASAVQEFAQQKKAVQELLQQKELDDSALLKKLFKTPVGQWTFLIDRGVGTLINTVSVEKKHEPAFDSVKHIVSEDYYKKQAKERLSANLEKAKKAAKSTDIASIKDQFGVKVETTDWIKKDDQEQLKKLSDKGLPVDPLFALNKGGVTTVENDHNGYLIAVVAQQEFVPDEFKAKQQEIKQKLYQEAAELTKQGYIASLYRNATIKTMKDSDFSPDSVPMEEPV